MSITVATGLGAIAAYGAAALVIAAAAVILVRFAIRSSRSIRKGCTSCPGSGPDACAGCPGADGCASRYGGKPHDGT
jgi:hypothetical protein